MTTSRVLVALATFNEINNLPDLVDELHRVLPDADLLVIDDSSPDGTGRWCDQRSRTESRLKCVHRPGKQGLGSATLTAMRFALEGPYNVIVTMDADWSHDPQYLPALVQAIEHADVALGSRYCAGGAIDGWSLRRRILSRGMNGLSRLMLGLPVRDTSGAFRAYRVEALKKIDLANIRSVGYSYVEEILWHLHRAGAKFVEVPITFRDRRAGQSKISAREAWNKVSTLFRLKFQRK